MLPIPDKAYVTGEFVEDWNNVKDGHAYIILTMDDGIVFKVIYNQLRTRKKLLLRSLNTLYEPYEVSVENVKEIWKFTNYISNELPQPVSSQAELADSVANLQEQINKLQKMVKA